MKEDLLLYNGEHKGPFVLEYSVKRNCGKEKSSKNICQNYNRKKKADTLQKRFYQ